MMRSMSFFSVIPVILLGSLVSFAQEPEPQLEHSIPPPAAELPVEPPPTLEPVKVEPIPAAATETVPPDRLLFQNAEGYQYDPTGKRDPFKPYGESQTAQAPELNSGLNKSKPSGEPLLNYDVAQFKLLGIIWQVKDPKAMLLDPSGKTHLIRRQTKIGRNNGFVAAIREGEVIVVEPSVGENGVQTAVTRVLNLVK